MCVKNLMKMLAKNTRRSTEDCPVIIVCIGLQCVKLISWFLILNRKAKPLKEIQVRNERNNSVDE